jgi:RNA polymerase sigma-70 factor (ECF subfamily)
MSGAQAWRLPARVGAGSFEAWEGSGPLVTTTPDHLAPLMPRIAAGDRTALRTLYDATASKLLGVCLRILSNREEAEDVLQDVYVTAWRRADRYDPQRASVAAWLSTIARNRAIDRLRARGPLAKSDPIEDVEIADEAPGAEAGLHAADEARRLAACLDELDARTQSVIRTAFFEGVTYEALARRLETPLGTVKSWIRRGLARLKGCLER